MSEQQLLMPKATAVWLVDNTSLSFRQIGKLCNLHELQVQAIADGEASGSVVGLDPIQNGQLTREEIARCEADPAADLQLVWKDLPKPKSRTKGPRYTPVTKRGDKPDAIAWLLKFHPELKDTQISRLIGTTRPTIAAVRDKTHHNAPNIKPRHPVILGLCKHDELEKAVNKAGGTLRTDAEATAATLGLEQAQEKDEPFSGLS